MQKIIELLTKLFSNQTITAIVGKVVSIVDNILKIRVNNMEKEKTEQEKEQELQKNIEKTVNNGSLNELLNLKDNLK